MTATPRTAPELIKALVALGHDKAALKELSVKELKELFKGSKAGSVGEKGSSSDECQIYDAKTSKFVRSYSKEVHGADFKKLAKQFCEKNPHCFIK